MPADDDALQVPVPVHQLHRLATAFEAAGVVFIVATGTFADLIAALDGDLCPLCFEIRCPSCGAFHCGFEIAPPGGEHWVDAHRVDKHTDEPLLEPEPVAERRKRLDAWLEASGDILEDGQ